MVKMIGYARVSTLVQTEGHSIEYQKEAIQKYCQLHDISLVKIYKDEGFSALKERPDFEKAMKRVLLDKEVDGIIVRDLTRFGRSTDDLRINVFKINDAGKKFISLKENIDISTSSGKLVLTILSAIADYEREIIIDRMQSGKDWAKIHGTKSGKPMCRPKKIIDFNIVRDRRSHGYSFNKIAQELKVSVPTLISRCKEENVR